MTILGNDAGAFSPAAMKVTYPHVRFQNCVASAYSTDSGLDRDWLGAVYMTKDTLAQRTLAERALRKTFRLRA